jgi:hypothetical protein
MIAIAFNFQAGNAPSNSPRIAVCRDAGHSTETKQTIEILQWARRLYRTLALANAPGFEGGAQIHVISIGPEEHAVDSEIDYCI